MWRFVELSRQMTDFHSMKRPRLSMLDRLVDARVSFGKSKDFRVLRKGAQLRESIVKI